jgi:heterodisulfide reductase subunit C
MQIVQQILFLLITVVAVWMFSKKIAEIRRNIFLGKKEEMGGDNATRWRNVLLLALGQKKMFRYPLVAVMHLVIYVGFIIINIEVLEIVLDGLFGTHRMFAPYLGSFYTFLINFFEILAVGVIIVCVAFLYRRNIKKVKRFRKRELAGWPSSDANYILITEIVLMTLFLTMNTTDRALQVRGTAGYYDTGSFLISGLFAPLLENASTNSLIIIERVAWWLHIIGIYAFLNYLPYSKHLHIVLAFPNAYYTRTDPKGKMENMPHVAREVQYVFQPELAATAETAEAPAKFGARDIFDLSFRNLLDAYSCTECGRCTAACPASKTGKLLSPRKIMMDTRDRCEDVGKNINKNKSFVDDGKTLLHDYILVEELNACTTCNACVEECPVGIEPLAIILELRRSLIMEESNAPQEWNAMFNNIENNYAPWKFSPEERERWRE